MYLIIYKTELSDNKADFFCKKYSSMTSLNESLFDLYKQEFEDKHINHFHIQLYLLDISSKEVLFLEEAEYHTERRIINT